MEELVLALLLTIAAGGSVKFESSWLTFALLFPVMSVDGAGVGGKFGRGMIDRWPVLPVMRVVAREATQKQSSMGGGREARAEKRGETTERHDKFGRVLSLRVECCWCVHVQRSAVSLVADHLGQWRTFATLTPTSNQSHRASTVVSACAMAVDRIGPSLSPIS